MDWNEVEGNWKQFTGKVKEKWGQLTDDEVTEVDGKKDNLMGKIQEKYGYAKDMAEREITDFIRDLKATANDTPKTGL